MKAAREVIFCAYSTKESVCTQEITVNGSTVPAVLISTATVRKLQSERALGSLICDLSVLTPDLAARSWLGGLLLVKSELSQRSWAQSLCNADIQLHIMYMATNQPLARSKDSTYLAI